MKNLLSTLIITSALVSQAAFASDAKQNWNRMKAGSAPTVTATPSSDNGMYIVGGIGYGFATKKAPASYIAENGYSEGTYNAKPSKPTSFHLGLGMNLSDDFRVDGILSIKTSQTLSASFPASAPDAARNDVNASLEDFRYKSASFMLNGYYNIVEITEGINAYGNLGIGMTRVTLKNKQVATKDTENAFTWQAGLGLTGKMTDTVMWDLGYKYNHHKKVWSLNFSSHNIVATMRFCL